jgi:hypothetical protein
MGLSLDLTEIFPLTFSLLEASAAEELCIEFLRDWGAGNLHFFPMLVREKNYPTAVIELADYEFQRFFLGKQNFSQRKDSGLNLSLNSSCQFLHIQASAITLQCPAGLYVLWKSLDGQVEEKRLDIHEAALVDRLQDGMVVHRHDLTPFEQGVLQTLMDFGIVCEGRDSVRNSKGPPSS